MSVETPTPSGDCPDCVIAQGNVWTGRHSEGCVVCEARMVSHRPKFLRERHYESIADLEERAAFITAVNLEFDRRTKAST